MQAYDAIRKMISEDGRAATAISAAMGYSTGYLGVFIGRKSVPKADTLAKIARECGYELLMRNRETGEEIVIDPHTNNE